MKLKAFIYYLIIFVLLLIAFYLGSIIKDIPYLELQRKVSIGEISSLILTLFVALVVPYMLNKTIDNKRIEKDLLIKSCENLADELRDLRNLAESIFINKKAKSNEAKKVILKSRNNGNILHLIKVDCLTYVNNTEIHNTIDDLIENQRLVWDNLTVNIRDQKPRLTETAYINTEKDIYKYLGNLSKLIMRINNY